MTGSGAAQSLRPVSAEGPSAWPVPLGFGGRKNDGPLLHFGCVLTRRAARWALPRTTSLHRSDQFLHIPPDRLRGGHWRCGEGTPEMANRHGKQEAKTKRPGTFRCPGLCMRAFGRYAPMRNLHPVASDPRVFQSAGWLRLVWNARGSGANSVGPTTACRRNHHTPRRARAIGPRRVECW